MNVISEWHSRRKKWAHITNSARKYFLVLLKKDIIVSRLWLFRTSILWKLRLSCIQFLCCLFAFWYPDELKALIDAAHEMGIAVIMDIVHSHAVKNEVEGLGNFAGDPNQYFYPGARREHPAWDSLCFDYGKNEVIHFLLSNCKYWLEEYKFDGFRFDGVTSMLYYSHGLGEAFCNYGYYFNGHR